MSNSTFSSAGKAMFPDTSFTLYQRLQSPSSPESRVALEKFFSRYWYPLYVFARREGKSHHDASDLVQDFVSTELIGKGHLQKWDPEKGRLRTFLQVCLKRFGIKDFRKQNAQKRGGDKRLTHVSMDLDRAENYFGDSCSHAEAPDKLFEREWASATVGHATSKLAAQYGEKDKLKEFQLLLGSLNDRGDSASSTSYAEIAAELGISEGAVKQRMRLFRAKFIQCIRAVVGETVNPDEIDAEIGFVLEALSR